MADVQPQPVDRPAPPADPTKEYPTEPTESDNAEN